MPNPLYEKEPPTAALPLWLLSVVTGLLAVLSRGTEALLLLLPGKPGGSTEQRRSAACRPPAP
jgi:hypothetical protein